MKATTMRTLRQWHHYLGVFFAPLILLFAISGALQTFRLQDIREGTPRPPAWLIWIASVHRDQAVPRIEPDAPKPAAMQPALPAKPKAKKNARSFALEVFVALMALALTISTLLGVVIALNNRAMRSRSIVLLIAGTVLPVVLLLL